MPHALDPPHFCLGGNREWLRGGAHGPDNSHGADPGPAPATRGNLTMTSMAVNDAGQGALGDWQYKVTVRLRETGGVDMAVTNIQFQALFGSNILATDNRHSGALRISEFESR